MAFVREGMTTKLRGHSHYTPVGGHRKLLQLVCCVPCPAHCPDRQVLVLVLVPPPHVTEQSDQTLHSSQVPATHIIMRVAFFKRTTFTKKYLAWLPYTEHHSCYTCIKSEQSSLRKVSELCHVSFNRKHTLMTAYAQRKPVVESLRWALL